MKILNLTLLNLTLLAAPAMAQITLDAEHGAIDYGGKKIPAAQAQSPAGSPWMAFRPACSQLDSVVQADGQVFYGVQMPDGPMGWLWTFQPGEVADRTQALDILAGYGVCKSGTAEDGTIDVPIIYTKDLPQNLVAQPSALPTGDVQQTAIDTASRFRGLVLSGLAAFGLAVVGGALFLRRKDDSTQQMAEMTTQNDDDHDIFREV